MTRTRIGTPAPAGRIGLVALAGALTLAGCTSPGGDTGAASASSEPSATVEATEDVLAGELIVLAAASLEATFTELGALLEDENPGLTVTFSFGASSTLVEQLAAGAPADVLATANASTMENAGELVVDPAVFASNTLQIVVPSGNPGAIEGLADFADPDLRIALCAEEVPCGSAAVTVFEAAGIEPSVDTFEANVSATLNRAVMGEVDAALVYRTDVIGAGDAVAGIDFPESAEAVNDNLIAGVAEAANPDAAAAFLELVTSAQGQAVLEAAGFEVP